MLGGIMEVVVKQLKEEEFKKEVKEYLEQLKAENDIAEFPMDRGRYYYMLNGLVHEVRFEDDKMIDATFESWSKEEKNFVMNVLSDRIW